MSSDRTCALSSSESDESVVILWMPAIVKSATSSFGLRDFSAEVAPPIVVGSSPEVVGCDSEDKRLINLICF